MKDFVGYIVYRLMWLMAVGIVLLGILSKAHAVDFEPWAIEDVGKGMVKIEINVKDCITSFTLPKKNMHNSKVLDSMLDLAEERAAHGCN